MSTFVGLKPYVFRIPRLRDPLLSVLWFAFLLIGNISIRTRDASTALQGGIDGQVLVRVGVQIVIAIYLFFAVILNKHYKRQLKKIISIPVILFSLFIVYLAATTLWSPINIYYGAVRVFEFAIGTSFTLYCYYRMGWHDFDRKTWHTLTFIMVLPLVISFFAPTLVYSAESGTDSVRLGGILIHANALGFLAVLVFIRNYAFVIAEYRNTYRKTHYISMLVAVIVTMMTKSRAALITIIIASLIIWFITFTTGSRRKSVWLRVIFLFIFCVNCVIVFLVLGNRIEESLSFLWDVYVTRGYDLKSLTLLTGRTVLWGRIVKVLTSNPINFLFGFGYQSSRVLLPQVTGSFWNHAHNVFLGTLFETGMVGLVLIMISAGTSVILLLKRLISSKYLLRTTVTMSVVPFVTILACGIYGSSSHIITSSFNLTTVVFIWVLLSSTANNVGIDSLSPKDY